MSHRAIESFGNSATTTSLTFGSAALLILGVQPILLGDLAASGHVSLDQVGLIAMAEIVAIGIGVGFASSVLPLNRFRIVAVISSLIVGAANVFAGFSGGFGDLMLTRVFAGFGSGVLVWVTTSLIVRVDHPERLAGIFLAAQTLAQAAFAALLALAIVPSGGWSLGFTVLGLLVVAPCLLVGWLPNQMHGLTEQSSSQPPLTLPVLITAGVVVLQMAVVGNLWTFIEPIGVGAGIEAQTAQLVISFTLIMQAIGAGVAAVVATRFEPALTLIAGGLMQAGIAFIVGNYLTSNLIPFIVICSIFGFLWLFMATFHVRLAFAVEPTGRLALFGPSLQLLGSAMGPLLASLFVVGDDASGAANTSAVLAITSVGLLIILRLVFRPIQVSSHD